MQDPATSNRHRKRPWNRFRKNSAPPAEHAGPPVMEATRLPDEADDPFAENARRFIEPGLRPEERREAEREGRQGLPAATAIAPIGRRTQAPRALPDCPFPPPPEGRRGLRRPRSSARSRPATGHVRSRSRPAPFATGSARSPSRRPRVRRLTTGIGRRRTPMRNSRGSVVATASLTALRLGIPLAGGGSGWRWWPSWRRWATAFSSTPGRPTAFSPVGALPL